MLDYLGWIEAAKLIHKGICKTIEEKHVTYDFARLLEGAKKVSTTEFAERIIYHMIS